jgi:hypothetical protein
MGNLKIQALAKHLGIEVSEINEGYRESNFEIGDEEYSVYTDSEADEATEESIEDYIDECILPEIPKAYQKYFDRESFIEDAKQDGRGVNLAGYDHVESEVTIYEIDEDGDETTDELGTFYIYRKN